MSRVNDRVDYGKSPFSLRENETRAHVKISPREERRDTAVESVEWHEFHARSRFARSGIPEEK